MKKIILIRDFANKTQTLGRCTVYDENNKPLFSSVSLERGDNGNKKNISAIPQGSYKVVLEYSPKFKKKLWEIKGVPGRSECKFHNANYWYQLSGCVALGQKLKDINKDGYNDVTNSRYTMKQFHTALKNQTEVTLEIKACNC